MQQDLLNEFQQRDNLLAEGGGSMLGSLVTCKHFDLARELMAEGFSFGTNDKGLLLLSAVQDNAPAVAFLLSQGFDANSTNTADQSALHACKSGEVARILIRAGGAVNAQDRDGNTPLHLAHQKDKAEALIEHGADVTVKNRDGYTPERFLWFWAKTERAGDGYEHVARATHVRFERDALMAVVEGSMQDKPTQKRRAL